MKIFRQNTTPHWAVSLVPFLVLVATLVLVIKAFGADALSGASQVSLIFAAGVTVAISMLFYTTSWSIFEKAIIENIKSRIYGEKEKSKHGGTLRFLCACLYFCR